ncbi:MAG: N-acetyltransferase domain-containing protein [Lachnoclostridium sp.]|jgi:N-acetylglutamate synthase-like GNAT family acetyltransferase
MNIIKLSLHPELFAKAAEFFHNKWQVPKDAYLASMKESLTAKGGVPEWYVVKQNNEIIAGLGVIENDFHKRPDLRPNLCAVYVKEPYRHQGIARGLMDAACKDLYSHGVTDVYLITDHTEFYEHCGWDFYGEIEENSGNVARCYHRKTKGQD